MHRIAGLALVAVSIVVAGAALADRRPPSVMSSQPFAAGALPGSPGIILKTKGSDAHCGGVALTATVKKAKKPDKHLAAVFAIKYPTGLDFDPKREAKRKKSMQRFDTWFDSLQKAVQEATAHYREIVADTKVGPADRVAAAGRMVQSLRWSAHVVARAEIPKDLRASEFPEARQVFCDTIAEKAETLEMVAVDAADRCRELASTINAGAGWWDDACAP